MYIFVYICSLQFSSCDQTQVILYTTSLDLHFTFGFSWHVLQLSCLQLFPFKVTVNVFLGKNIHFWISSYSVSRTFKAHNDTLLEANKSFKNGRNFM